MHRPPPAPTSFLRALGETIGLGAFALHGGALTLRRTVERLVWYGVDGPDGRCGCHDHGGHAVVHHYHVKCVPSHPGHCHCHGCDHCC